MKKLLIVAVVFATALVSCNGSKSIKSFSEKDSLAYSWGLDYGTHAKMVDSTLNPGIIAQAIFEVMKGKNAMTIEQANEFRNEYYTVRLPKRQKEEATAYLEDVKAKNPNIKTTESGLMYEIINEGDMSVRAIEDADEVLVNYRGTLKDGTEFDANDSLKFALNRVIPAWTEGMKLVGKGGEIVLWVPSELGYGERAQGQIPANSALKFEITLLDIVPAVPAE
jgi:FKBP-type peptidyl-prolyl cis-trans isomerase